MNTNPVDLLQSILEKTSAIVAGVKPDQMSLPTPCPDYDVETLLKHMDSWLHKFAVETAGEASDVDAAAYEFPTDIAADFRANAEKLVAARRQQSDPDAGALGMNMIEYVVHGWSLAVATGQPVPYTDEEASAALATGQAIMKPEYRGEAQPFGVEVPAPPGATATEKLAAFMGYNLAWTPEQN